MADNPGVGFDAAAVALLNRGVSAYGVYESVKSIPEEKCRLPGLYRAAWLLRAVSCIDLTTLSGDETRSDITMLCRRALSPIKTSLLDTFGFTDYKPFTTAAVCVYPKWIDCARDVIPRDSNVKIATVAGGFPSAQYGLQSRLKEIDHAYISGAREIDVVIDRSRVLSGDWEILYNELVAMKRQCKGRTMKTILSTGELATFQNIYKASFVAMMAGSDFIKTSTGKEAVNATLPAGLVMLRAIKDYYQFSRYQVGFKAAGGIKTADDALNWLLLVNREMGKSYLKKDLFRIGASSLLDDINEELCLLAGEAEKK